jgi:uncharacterized protein
MKVRKPNYDYMAALPHWCKTYPEYGQLMNVTSLALPYLEPYLNLVMRRAQAKLDPAHPLNEDIAVFCKQEAAHYLQHREYNQALYRAGYEKLPKIEARFQAHFDRVLNEESLKFNCAYCLAFESLGPIIAEMWFEGLDDVLVGADPAVVSLWRWHLAEEYEHRTVAFDVYQTLFGNYFYRVYGLYRFLKDLRMLNREALRYLLEEDRRQMTASEIAASRQRLAQWNERERRFWRPRLLKCLSPFYNPRNIRPPKGAAELLRQVEQAA